MNQFGFSCPQCGSGRYIDVHAWVWVRLTPDGTDADLVHDGGHEWNKRSQAYCNGCTWVGVVGDLKED